MKDLVTNLDSRAPAAPAQAFLMAADYSAYGTKGDVPAGGFVPGAVPEGITLRDAFSGKEDQGPDFGLQWLDFGARAYSPALRRWMTPDPLGEKYPAVNPYAYCAGDPVNYVDPTGMDIWEIDERGIVRKYTKTESEDAFYLVRENNEGVLERTGDYISFEYKTISYKKISSGDKDHPYDFFELRGDDKGKALFEFFANNTSVEWGHFLLGISGEKGLNIISSSHQEDSDQAAVFLYNNRLVYGYTIRSFNHYHPSNSCYPSPQDVGTAFIIERRQLRLGRKLPTFFIYTRDSNHYYQYNSNSHTRVINAYSELPAATTSS